MKKWLYWALQLTWALPLNLIGALAALIFSRRKALSYHGARVGYWDGNRRLHLSSERGLSRGGGAPFIP